MRALAEARGRRRLRELREHAVVIRVAHSESDIFEVFADPAPDVAVEQDDVGERWWEFDGSTA